MNWTQLLPTAPGERAMPLRRIAIEFCRWLLAAGATADEVISVLSERTRWMERLRHNQPVLQDETRQARLLHRAGDGGWSPAAALLALVVRDAILMQPLFGGKERWTVVLDHETAETIRRMAWNRKTQPLIRGGCRL